MMSDKFTQLRSGWKYTAAGADMFASSLVGAAIGYFLDKWFDTDPWMLVVWFVLGSAAGLFSVYRRMQEGMNSQPPEKSK